MPASQDSVRLETVHWVDMPSSEQTSAMRNLLRFLGSGYMFEEVEQIFLLNDIETDIEITAGRVIDLLAPTEGMIAPTPLSVTLSLQ